MRQFVDKAGRTWDVVIDTVSGKRLKSLLKVDISEAATGDLVERLAADPILLVDVLYVVCKPQADKLGVSDEDFGRSMGGDAIEAATNALLEELIDFFPTAKRTALRNLLAKTKQAEARILDRMERILGGDQFDLAIDQAIETADKKFCALVAGIGGPTVS